MTKTILSVCILLTVASVASAGQVLVNDFLDATYTEVVDLGGGRIVDVDIMIDSSNADAETGLFNSSDDTLTISYTASANMASITSEADITQVNYDLKINGSEIPLMGDTTSMEFVGVDNFSFEINDFTLSIVPEPQFSVWGLTVAFIGLLGLQRRQNG